MLLINCTISHISSFVKLYSSDCVTICCERSIPWHTLWFIQGFGPQVSACENYVHSCVSVLQIRSIHQRLRFHLYYVRYCYAHRELFNPLSPAWHSGHFIFLSCTEMFSVGLKSCFRKERLVNVLVTFYISGNLLFSPTVLSSDMLRQAQVEALGLNTQTHT